MFRLMDYLGSLLLLRSQAYSGKIWRQQWVVFIAAGQVYGLKLPCDMQGWIIETQTRLGLRDISCRVAIQQLHIVRQRLKAVSEAFRDQQRPPVIRRQAFRVP